ncbi:biopolymer transporter ExbD [Erythrobacter sp. Alg231-14]|uniref:biopolymer transporter ExbD n=1 Tax=Erythrobacter sp. Alg231-14 TaxID=1922225 RepID=UPI000D55D9E1
MPQPIRKHVKGLRRASPSIVPKFEIGAPISRIDTRPMVFVFAMILLFAVIWNAAQERTHALLVDLPRWHAPPNFGQAYMGPAYMVVSIGPKGGLALDDVPVTLDGLSQAILAKGFDWPIVMLEAKPNTAYGRVALALGKIREAGVAQADICFDPSQLEEHRSFKKTSFQSASAIIEEEGQLPREFVPFLPSGCDHVYDSRLVY